MRRDEELAGWIRLSLVPGLQPSALRALLGRFGLPDRILSASSDELAAIAPGTWQNALYAPAIEEALRAALEWASKPGHTLVTLADGSYPGRLLETADPPAVLYARGKVELLSRPAVAIVGSRNATPQGLRNAASFARALSDEGLTIVSGLALGVDAAAHRGALAGPGSTVAVLGAGIDVLYPPRNAALAEEIAREGLLLSECVLGSPPFPGNFPRRNRIISGMSVGCLVVEAATNSGSLITARLAADHGREVFAIPGSIHSPLSRGCHALIKAGAKLVESSQDILAELSWRQTTQMLGVNVPSENVSSAEVENHLLAHIGDEPIDLETLCARTGLSADKVSGELLHLELDGRVAALPGGRFQRLR